MSTKQKTHIHSFLEKNHTNIKKYFNFAYGKVCAPAPTFEPPFYSDSHNFVNFRAIDFKPGSK